MNYQSIKESLPSPSETFEACYAFSVHKCGSTMMHSMIGAVCTAEDIPAANLPTYFFNEGLPDNVWSHDPEAAPVFNENLLYFGFRALPNFFKNSDFSLENRRFVLLVRDPRDALVSQYFSFGKKDGSHKMPEKGAEQIKKQMAKTDDLTIDQYVLRVAPQLRNKLSDYRDTLTFENGLMRRYEDVFFDKKTFLSDIFAHFQIPVSASVIADVAAKFDIRPDVEDQSKHIRKGTPGDHAEKLQPETIEALNDTFREIGAFYGYTL